ncbi:hypothetical protein HELRODRAFT_165111 [Helobdella robusta]|uniref:Uncharacterized protein n=1 Tax=Helobdella robusta TaxID=6412 RepID=T1EWB0_HELRO|nr:hypothetical protein HELRODRAFT_165111 [Helobdella robusta]ESN92967.1 hypothetical protein HELRODRAFT_165111 [Helobdella robusta]
MPPLRSTRLFNVPSFFGGLRQVVRRKDLLMSGVIHFSIGSVYLVFAIHMAQKVSKGSLSNYLKNHSLWNYHQSLPSSTTSHFRSSVGQNNDYSNDYTNVSTAVYNASTSSGRLSTFGASKLKHMADLERSSDIWPGLVLMKKNEKHMALLYAMACFLSGVLSLIVFFQKLILLAGLNFLPPGQPMQPTPSSSSSSPPFFSSSSSSLHPDPIDTVLMMALVLLEFLTSVIGVILSLMFAVQTTTVDEDFRAIFRGFNNDRNEGMVSIEITDAYDTGRTRSYPESCLPQATTLVGRAQENYRRIQYYHYRNQQCQQHRLIQQPLTFTNLQTGLIVQPSSPLPPTLPATVPNTLPSTAFDDLPPPYEAIRGSQHSPTK